MSHQRTLLLSLRPRFAEAILSGVKTVELRRRPINAHARTPIILYASSPTMAIVGTARLREVQTLGPQAAWREHRVALGLTRSEFDAYLDGSRHAYLLLLYGVTVLNEPLSLHRLREEGQFHPPQSFRYVAASDPAPLHGLIATASRALGNRRWTARPETVPKLTSASGTSSASAPARMSPRDIGRHHPIWTLANS